MTVELIAEVSSNHGGDLVLAKEFIHACAEAGADWVKFQTTRVKHLSPDDSQFDWFANAELSDDAHYALRDECTTQGVKFLTTVFNEAEVPFLASLGLEAIKVGSGEASERDLALAVREVFPRVFVSLGLGSTWDKSPFLKWKTMASIAGYVCANQSRHVQFLRCLSRYPSPASSAQSRYERPVVGWSDHCRGLEGCYTAIVNGATIIEKHVQLPNQARPPKPYEATMQELRELRQFADESPERFIGRWQHA